MLPKKLRSKHNPTPTHPRSRIDSSSRCAERSLQQARQIFVLHENPFKRQLARFQSRLTKYMRIRHTTRRFHTLHVSCTSARHQVALQHGFHPSSTVLKQKRDVSRTKETTWYTCYIQMYTQLKVAPRVRARRCVTLKED